MISRTIFMEIWFSTNLSFCNLIKSFLSINVKGCKWALYIFSLFNSERLRIKMKKQILFWFDLFYRILLLLWINCALQNFVTEGWN